MKPKINRFNRWHTYVFGYLLLSYVGNYFTLASMPNASNVEPGTQWLCFLLSPVLWPIFLLIRVCMLASDISLPRLF